MFYVIATNKAGKHPDTLTQVSVIPADEFGQAAAKEAKAFRTDHGLDKTSALNQRKVYQHRDRDAAWTFYFKYIEHNGFVDLHHTRVADCLCGGWCAVCPHCGELSPGSDACNECKKRMLVELEAWLEKEGWKQKELTNEQGQVLGIKWVRTVSDGYEMHDEESLFTPKPPVGEVFNASCYGGWSISAAYPENWKCHPCDGNGCNGLRLYPFRPQEAFGALFVIMSGGFTCRASAMAS